MSNQIKVLLIGEESDDIEKLRQIILCKNGDFCISAQVNNFDKFLPDFRNGHFDVIIIAKRLIFQETINEIHLFSSYFPEVPIILLGKNTDLENEASYLAQGVDDILIFSEIDEKIFQESVHKSIGRKRFQNQNIESLKEQCRLSERYLESNGLKELLIDVVTHDLKNAAGGIYSFTNLMAEGVCDPEITDYIRLLSKRLVDTIDNVSVLSKATSGEEIEMGAIDLVQVIHEVVDEYSHSFKTVGLEVEINCKEPMFIRANHIISQVVRNYLNNAIKYAASGRKIIIDARPLGSQVLMGIADFGETIPADQSENIFERKIQLENGKNRGSGFGLAIVKRIAQAHGAKVWTEPNNPTGNRFCLLIERAC